jgi:hypothetical protein
VAQLASAVIAVCALVISGRALLVSNETLRAHERRFEIEASPWLSGSSLKPQSVPEDEDPMRLQCDAYLVLRNVGRTPAGGLSIQAEWAIFSKDGLLVRTRSEPVRADLALAPGDEHHQRLCRLPFDAPGQIGKIKTCIRYTSAVGGIGEVRLSFVQRPAPRGAWVNGPSRYWFQTSGGVAFGERGDLPGWAKIQSYYDPEPAASDIEAGPAST